MIREITNEEFDKFITSNHYDSIYQTSTYGKIMAKNGYNSMLVGLFNNNDMVGASLILIENRQGFKYAIAPHGFVVDYDNLDLVKRFTNCLKNYLKSKNIIALKINPKIIKNKYDADKNIIYHNENFDSIMHTLKSSGFYHYGYNSFFEATKPRFEANLKLSENYYALFNNIKKSFRTKIRNAEKNAIVIHKGNKNSIKDLYLETKRKYPRSEKFLTDFYEEFNENKQVSIYYAKVDTNNYLLNAQKEYANQEALCEKLDNDVLTNSNNNLKVVSKKIVADNLLNERKNKLKSATNLLKNYPDGIIIASIMTVVNGETVTLFMDGYNKNYQKFNAKHLLLWKVIERYAKLGYKNFNLGGITNIFDTNDRYKGLNEFKLNFNPEVIEYAGDLELVCNSPLYFMYRNSITFKKMIKK